MHFQKGNWSCRQLFKILCPVFFPSIVLIMSGICFTVQVTAWKESKFLARITLFAQWVRRSAFIHEVRFKLIFLYLMIMKNKINYHAENHVETLNYWKIKFIIAKLFLRSSLFKKRHRRFIFKILLDTLSLTLLWNILTLISRCRGLEQRVATLL